MKKQPNPALSRPAYGGGYAAAIFANSGYPVTMAHCKHGGRLTPTLGVAGSFLDGTFTIRRNGTARSSPRRAVVPPCRRVGQRWTFSSRRVCGGAVLPAVTPAHPVGGFCVQRGAARKGVWLSLLAHRLARPAASCVCKGLVRSSVLPAGVRVRPGVFWPCPCASGDGLTWQIGMPCP